MNRASRGRTHLRRSVAGVLGWVLLCSCGGSVDTSTTRAPGSIVTIAGNGKRATSGGGLQLGKATEVALDIPDVAVSANDVVFIATLNEVAKLTPAGTLETVAGEDRPVSAETVGQRRGRPLVRHLVWHSTRTATFLSLMSPTSASG
jgi:hypothetical protein